MSTIKFIILEPVEVLKRDVEYFRIAEYVGEEGVTIKVCPNGFPGIVFQHSNGQPAIRSIVTSSGRIVNMPPTLFLYGQVTELSVMNYKNEPYTTVQAVLKPHALKTLFGLNASALTNGSIGYQEFDAEDLNIQLIKAQSNEEYINLFTNFLLGKLKLFKPRDTIVEESMSYIHSNISNITVKNLLGQLYLSERQFEKRFVKAVGVSPQFYIRVKRFNEAMKLIDSGKFDRLSDVAQVLNYFDQSHFIRDIKVFSGITPKSISQKIVDFHHDQIGSSYLV
jgi:AraC-like DNA-binding protein